MTFKCLAAGCDRLDTTVENRVPLEQSAPLSPSARVQSPQISRSFSGAFMLRKFLLSSLATVGMIASAAAADLPTEKGPPVYPPPPPPQFSWTGCYIGADGGVAWNRENVTNSGSVLGDQGPTAGTLNGTSAIGGPHAGCNWQFATTWVIGAEGDFSWTHLYDPANAPNLYSDGTPVGVGGINWSRDLYWLASIRGRVGYSVTPNILLYGTGGVAFERSSLVGVDTGIVGSRTTAFGQTQTGFVAGAGIDWAPWSNNWIFGVEYLHYQFAGTSSTVFFPNPVVFNWGTLGVDSVRAAVSYKF
jgi:outer membrane immunogenic protein